MKQLALYLCLLAPACAQWVVFDPTNHAVNAAIQSGQAANHAEVIARWAEELEKLNRQIQQIEETINLQRRIRDVMGDPVGAGQRVILDGLGDADAAKAYGDTLRATRRLVRAVDALRRTFDGIYESLDDRTVLRSDFTRRPELYRRYDALEQRAGDLERVHDLTDARLHALLTDQAATLQQLQAAATQAETDKLGGKLAVLNGQIAHVDNQRRDAADRLRAQQILNDNQAAKERQDLLEKQIAEERQTLNAVNAWQAGLKIAPTEFRRP